MFSLHLNFLPLPLLKKKRGRPPGPRIPTPPSFYFQNKGGISRTQSQTVKERMKEKDETAISSLEQNSLICFEKCVNNKHTKLCLRKALTSLEWGDTYINQKSAHELSQELNFDNNKVQLKEDKEEEDNLGLGGTTPIPSFHYSFEDEETLENIPEEELQDKFSQEDKNFLSAVDEFKWQRSSMNKTLAESELSKEEQEETVLAETKQVRHKVEELLPRISPALQKELYSKINWANFSPGQNPLTSGPSTSTPARATQSSGQVKDEGLPTRPLEYKTFPKKKRNQK